MSAMNRSDADRLARSGAGLVFAAVTPRGWAFFDALSEAKIAAQGSCVHDWATGQVCGWPERMTHAAAQRCIAEGGEAFIVHLGRTDPPVIFRDLDAAEAFAKLHDAVVNDYETGERA